jgi:hypothetical protein
MKKHLFFILAFTIMTSWQALAEEWGTVTNNLQMSISLTSGENEIITNQPVVLLVRYKNISTNETITIYNDAAISRDATYSFVVTSPSGKDLSPNLPKSINGSGGIYPLSPNQTQEFKVNLSQLCKFDELGIYRIIANKTIWSSKERKWFTVTSNQLSIVTSE